MRCWGVAEGVRRGGRVSWGAGAAAAPGASVAAAGAVQERFYLGSWGHPCAHYYFHSGFLATE